MTALIWTFKGGEFLSIMGGPSGSGKSTFKHFGGVLDKPSAGSYFLEEVDVTWLKDRELAKIRNEHFGLSSKLQPYSRIDCLEM